MQIKTKKILALALTLALALAAVIPALTASPFTDDV